MAMKRGSRKSTPPVPKPPANNSAFEAQKLISVLEAAYLGGAIEECVLKVKGGIGTIAAVDKTSCVFALSRGPVGPVPDADLGLKEVGFFIKAVGAAGTEKIDYQVEEGKWFRLQMQGTGDIKLLLSPPDLIPTAIGEWEGPVEKMRSATPYQLPLSKDSCERFLYFQDLVKNNATMLSIRNGVATLGSGRFETRTFTVQIGEVKAPDMDIVVLGEYLKAVLQVLDWADGAAPPIMFFGEGAPILVEQTGERNGFWSLSPSTEGA